METAFRVLLDDGEWYDIREPKLSDLVAFERHFGVPASALDPVDQVTLGPDGEQIVTKVSVVKLEWVCFLLWRGLRKAGVIGDDVAFDDDFIDRVEDVEIPGADKETTENPPVPELPLG